MTSKKDKFKNILDKNYIWPAKYPFKFIVLSEKVDLVKKKINIEFEVKKSSNGKYSSISFEIIANSSQEIIDIYDKLKNIEGLISL